jgi:hypothetical protein
LGYEHTFTHEIYDFLKCVSEKKQPSPSFDDGLYIQKVLDAVEASANNNSSSTPVR